MYNLMDDPTLDVPPDDEALAFAQPRRGLLPPVNAAPALAPDPTLDIPPDPALLGAAAPDPTLDMPPTADAMMADVMPGMFPPVPAPQPYRMDMTADDLPGAIPAQQATVNPEFEAGLEGVQGAITALGTSLPFASLYNPDLSPVEEAPRPNAMGDATESIAGMGSGFAQAVPETLIGAPLGPLGAGVSSAIGETGRTIRDARIRAIREGRPDPGHISEEGQEDATSALGLLRILTAGALGGLGMKVGKASAGMRDKALGEVARQLGLETGEQLPRRVVTREIAKDVGRNALFDVPTAIGQSTVTQKQQQPKMEWLDALTEAVQPENLATAAGISIAGNIAGSRGTGRALPPPPTPGTDPQAPTVATGKMLPPVNADTGPMNAERFQRQIREAAPFNTEETETVNALVEGLARAKGETADEYLSKRVEAVRPGREEDLTPAELTQYYIPISRSGQADVEISSPDGERRTLHFKHDAQSAARRAAELRKAGHEARVITGHAETDTTIDDRVSRMANRLQRESLEEVPQKWLKPYVDQTHTKHAPDTLYQEADAPPAEDKYPGRLGIKRMADLGDEQRAVEERTAKYAEDNFDSLVEKYEAKHPNFISGDEAKALFPDFNANDDAPRKFASAVHTSTTPIVDEVFRRALARPEVDTAVFTAGGPASGKTYATKKALPTPEAGTITYDTTLAGGGAKRRIQQALDAGKDVEINYVHRPVEVAARSAVERALEPGGRTLPVDAIADDHYNAQRTLLDVEREFAGQPVRVRVIDNSGDGPGSVKIVDTNFLRERLYPNKELLRERVREDIADEIRTRAARGERIPDEIWTGFFGRDADRYKTAADTRGTGQARGRDSSADGGEPEAQPAEGSGRKSGQEVAPPPTTPDGDNPALYQNTDKPRTAQTDTPEFKRWFGESKVTDAQGKPLVVYHQTTKANEQAILTGPGFSTDAAKARARLSDEQVPNGIFFKPDSKDIQVGSADASEISQMAVYLSLKNPLMVDNRDALDAKISSLSDEYREKSFDLRELNRNFTKRFDDVWNQPDDPQAETRRNIDKSNRLDTILEEWKAATNAKAAEMRAIVDDVLAREGYDGVILENDAGSFGRKTKTYIALRSEQAKSTSNRGTFDPNNPSILAQRDKKQITAKGSVEFTDLPDGTQKAVIKLFKNADVSTLIHELGHIARRTLDTDDLNTLSEWAGAAPDTWTRAAEEKFARAFEKYVTDGRAPTPRLASVFEKLKNWMRQIYTTLRNSSIDVDIPANVREVFDGLFLTPDERTARKTNQLTGARTSHPITRGKETTVTFDSGEDFPARYVLGEADDLINSHQADTNFQPDPDYPQSKFQPRVFDEPRKRQLDRMAKNWDAGQWVNQLKTVGRSMPIANEDGFVLAGNGRKGALDLLRKNHPEEYTEFQEHQRDAAERFGFTPEQFDALDNPVIWRVLENADDEKQQHFAQLSNEPDAALMGNRETAGMVHKVISEAETRFFTEIFRAGTDASNLSQFINKPDIQNRFIRMLQRTFPNRAANYVEDSKLNSAGRDLFSRAIYFESFKKASDGEDLARWVSEAVDEDDPNRGIRRRLDNAMFQINQINSDLDITNPWKLTKSLPDAIRFLRESEKHRSGGERLMDVFNQPNIWGDDLRKPSEKALSLARAIDEGGVNNLRDTLKQYLARAKSSLLDPNLSPTRSLKSLVDKEFARLERQREIDAANEARIAEREGTEDAPRDTLTEDVFGGADTSSDTETGSKPSVREQLRQEVDEEIGRGGPSAGLSVESVSSRAAQTAAKRHNQQLEFNNPEIEKAWQESKKIPKPRLSDRLAEALTRFKHAATREFEHLERGATYAETRLLLSRLQKGKGIAGDQALMDLQGITKSLTPYEDDLLGRKIVLDDLLEDAEIQRDRGKTTPALPFGFDEESLKAELDRVDRELDNHPDAKRARKQYKQLHQEVWDDYKAAAEAVGVKLPDTRENYYRHMVLDYAQAARAVGTGSTLHTPDGRSHLKTRQGSTRNILSDYLQAEHSVLSQLYYDTQVFKMLEHVEKKFDISAKLKEQAKTDDEAVFAKPDGTTGKRDWRQLLPDTHVLWQPKEGNLMHKQWTVPERFINMAMEKGLKEIGVPVERFKQALVIGARRREIAIPKELAETLDHFGKPMQDDFRNTLDRLWSQKVMGSWKAWQLSGPTRIVRATFRNLTGDLEKSIQGNAKSLTRIPRAVEDLYTLLYRKGAPSTELKAWIERGGLHNVLSTAEGLGDDTLRGLAQFRNLTRPGTIDWSKANVWKQYWRYAKQLGDFREAILRYSNFLEYHDQMKKSDSGLPRNYGASLREEVKALDSLEDRAYKLSNDLLGAYDEVGVVGQGIAKRFIPFFRFSEVNARSYKRLLQNALIDAKTSEQLTGKLAGTARAVGVAAPRIAKFAIMMGLFRATLQVYNHFMHDEEEKDLPSDVRNRTHIVFGRDDNGQVEYFDRLGTSDDILEWFGLNEFQAHAKDLINDRKTLPEVASDMAMAPVNKLANSLGPTKTAFEAMLGVQIFPNVSNPRPIRDRWQHIANSVGLDNEYNVLMGKPTRGIQHRLETLAMYKIDPGEVGYNEIIGLRSEYQKSKGRGFSGGAPTPRANALYDYKKAVRYKDTNAAKAALVRYAMFGGTKQGLAQSFKALHPLNGLDQDDKREFVDTLDTDQREALRKAMEYYEQHLKPGMYAGRSIRESD